MKLETRRTTIAPIQNSDVDEILEMYQEPDSNTFIPPLLNKSLSYYEEFLAGKIESNKNEIGFWTVRLSENDTFIGTVNLNKFKDTDMIHVGCHLKKSHWGKGYAFELLTTLVDYGLNSRNLSHVYGILSEEHHVSMRLMEKLGFSLHDSFTEENARVLIYRTE